MQSSIHSKTVLRNPDGKITLTPLFMETAVSIYFVAGYVNVLVVWVIVSVEGLLFIEVAVCRELG